jgi:hypothetical protein
LKKYGATNVYRDDNNNIIAHFRANHDSYKNKRMISFHVHMNISENNITSKKSSHKHIKFEKTKKYISSNNETYEISS